MFKHAGRLLFVILLCFVVLGSSTVAEDASAVPVVWVSPEYTQVTQGWGVTHFSKIQDAVNTVSYGGTVNVGAGTYQENVVIKKGLKLIGEGKDKTKIMVTNKVPCINVLNGNVDISGFTLEKPWGTDSMDAALNVNGSNVNISNNSFISTGLIFGGTQNSTIKNNSFKGVGTILFSGAYGNNIENNDLEEYYPGSIYVFGSNNVFLNNRITGHNLDASCTGIRFVFSSNNLFAHNMLKGFRTHVLLTASDNNIIADNDISKSWSFGLYKPMEARNQCGMILHQSKNNTVINNHIYDTLGSGIRMFNSSSNNIIKSNIIEKAGQGGGIELFYNSDDNEIINNEISKSPYGIILNSVSNNKIYKNNLINNSIQSYDNGKNLWTFEGMGNFWSDFKAFNNNGNGIGGIPYTVSSGVYDLLPAIKRNEIVKIPVPPLELATVKQPIFGDVTINTETVWENKTVELDQVLNVNNGGSLILRNVNVKINIECEGAINVLSGGNLEIYNCKIEGRGQNIMVKKGGKIRVENSILDSLCDWDGNGSLYTESDGAIIKNNIIKGGYVGIQLFDGSTNNEITGNSISECNDGIIFWNQEKGENTVSSNTISNIINNGIYGSGLTDSLVKDNTFKNIWGIGIHLRPWAMDGGVKRNTIYNNDFINCRIAGLLTDGDEKNAYYYNSRGNYWSDYKVKYPDAIENKQYSGTWNSPYRIDSWDVDIVKSIYDPYPLMTPNNKSNISSLDITVPNISSITSNGSKVMNNGFAKQDVSIIVTDMDLYEKSVTMNGEGFKWPVNDLFSTEGKYVVTATDKAANKADFTFTIDLTAPKITVKSLSGLVLKKDASSKGGASILITETNISQKTINKNGDTIPWPSKNKVTAKGTYIINVTDKAGNTSTFAFKIET